VLFSKIQRSSSRNVNLKSQPWPGRPVTATHYVNMQKAQELVAKNQRISQTSIGEKLNTGLAHINEIIAGLAYKRCILDGCHFSLCTK